MAFRTRTGMPALVFPAAAMAVLAVGPAFAQVLPGSDIIPPSRLADWRPGVMVGVPGGTPTGRTHLIDVTKPPYNADKTGANNAQPAITSAIAAAKDKDVVYLPPGTYRINSSINIRNRNNITIRGAGPDKTAIMAYNTTGGAIDIGGGSGTLWNTPDVYITGSPGKGATVLTVGDTTPLNSFPNGGIGQLCRISLKNDYALPVVHVSSWDRSRRQQCRIVSKTPSTITISAPMLFALPQALNPGLKVATTQALSMGVEDLKIDATHSSTTAGLVQMSECYGSWVKNVTVMNVPNYSIWIVDCVQCEARHCYIANRQTEGSNGAGFLVDGDGFSLWEDNIITKVGPHVEVNNGASGNVLGYNYGYDITVYGTTLGASLDTNHDPHNSYNLYEGNCTPSIQCDGYFGSASEDTLFRNWFTGSSPGATGHWTVSLDRFTRNYSVVGNILGMKSLANGTVSQGNPNLGNGDHTGTAQPSKGIYWADWKKMKTSAPGSGPGPTGFQELDLDVQATTILKGNYYCTTNSVPAAEALHGTKLPKSLYLTAKPTWFGRLAWPPFGPDTGGFEKNSIPAQVRFAQGP